MDRLYQRPEPDDVHHAGQIVGEDRERYLRSHDFQPFHQEVRRARARSDRPKRMLDRLLAHAHGLQVRVQTPLHHFENVFVLPPVYRTIATGRAVLSQLATRTGAGRITPEMQAVGLPFVRVEQQRLASRTDVHIFAGDAAKVGLPELATSAVV